MKNKKLLISSALLALTAACQALADGMPVNVMELRTIKPVDSYFIAKVYTMDSGKLAFAIDRGLISETKKVGDIVTSSLYNADGSVAIKGTVVGKVVNDRQIAAYNAAEMKLKMDQEAYNLALLEIERDKKMEAAISRKQLENDMGAYKQSKFQLEQDKANLLGTKADLDGTELIAPFAGIITQITRGPGMGVGGPGDDFAEIMRMNPIVIKISLPSEIVNKIDNGKLIEVYAPGLDEPIPAWTGISYTDKDIVYAFVMNAIVPNLSTLTEEQKKLPKVYSLFPVIPFFQTAFAGKLNISKEQLFGKQYNANLLGVPGSVIHKDEKGTYIIRAVGQEAFTDHNDINPEFAIEKIYVKEGNLRDTNFGPFTLVSLDDPGSLKANDVVIASGEKSFQNGEKVAYCKPKWLFRPGDIVKVSIPSVTGPGFYVPKAAIIHESDGDNIVYTVVNNTVKYVKVDLVGTTGNFFSIKGDGIENGARVIIPRDNQVNELYDGMPVSINNVLPPSERLQHKHGTPIDTSGVP